MKGILKVVIAVAIMLLLASPAFAGGTETFPISAEIPPINGLDVDISRIDLPGEGWNPGQGSVNFGTLTWDDTNNIFRANSYFAVDVSITDNSGSWTIQHTSIPITNGTDNLDNNINVTFENQINNTTATPLGKFSYAAADGRTYTNAQITGWLRIYYGIAAGSGDAFGVVPIGAEKSPGTYTGSITLTLTSS